MINRCISVCMLILFSILLVGCGGTKCLIEDCKSMNTSSQVIEIEKGDEKEILNYRRGMMWGGYAPGLFSEDPEIVSIRYDEAKRGHLAIVKGKAEGSVKVYFVNRFGAGSAVDSTERAYWLENLEGSKFYFIVTVE